MGICVFYTENNFTMSCNTWWSWQLKTRRAQLVISLAGARWARRLRILISWTSSSSLLGQENHGNQPKTMKNHETTWKTMETNQKPRKTMKPPWNQPKPLKTYKNRHGTMKNQSGTIKTNLELDRVFMGGSGGYRRLPGGSNDFSLHTDTHHNIYIVLIIRLSTAVPFSFACKSVPF